MARETIASIEALRAQSSVGSARSWLWLVLLLVAVGTAICSLVLLATASERQISGTIVELLALGFNLIGILLLAGLIARKVSQLRKDVRSLVPGSKMRARAVGMITVITLVPIVVVYLFSVNTINRSIDSWFDVTMGNGLRDALTLSRTALSLRTRELSEHTRTIVGELGQEPELSWRDSLDRYRRFTGASLLMVVSEHNQILAFSSDFTESALPTLPANDVLAAARAGSLYTSLDPMGPQGYHLVTAIPMNNRYIAEPYVLVASYPVTAQLSELGNQVEQAHAKYASMLYNRPILKSSFTLTLTVVLLLAVLGAVYGAFFWVSRFIRPVEDLMMGTLAVIRGDLDQRLPNQNDDEMGQLIQSFNRMIDRVAQARRDAEDSRQIVVGERERLAIILARLSSGILALSKDGVLLDVNEAASRIVGLSLEQFRGSAITSLATQEPALKALAEYLINPVETPVLSVPKPVTLKLPAGTRDVLLIHTDLPVIHSNQVARLWVMDDLTQLLRAQREAAWGEVARRLAHEIKNPLTPIQLSADRMRRRLMGQLAAKDAEVLESGTRTIVHQVEAMRQMVNAFSDYAKAPSLALSLISLNELVGEVTQLYEANAVTGSLRLVQIERSLDPNAPAISADPYRIRQVLHNLLTNAFEALDGSSNPRIEIQTTHVTNEQGSFVSLAVMDNGAGFPADLSGREFDPYVTNKEKGTGLGLAIVKKIVDEHHGTIMAENRAEGGARVVIYWPASKMNSSSGVS